VDRGQDFVANIYARIIHSRSRDDLGNDVT
jgi:hypothetical protein